MRYNKSITKLNKQDILDVILSGGKIKIEVSTSCELFTPNAINVGTHESFDDCNLAALRSVAKDKRINVNYEKGEITIK